MNADLLDILCCPGCKGTLVLEGDTALRCTSCNAQYPIVRGIPRFVPADNYAESFGFQWNRFPRTQLDSTSGVPITRNRFFTSTSWSADEMRGKRVLDVGCGSGRFAEIALSTGARVVAVDYSSAVDACRANLGDNPRLDVVQADVYRLPFRDETFDFVYCLGVLQHTPDVRKAFTSLLPPLRRGGKISVDLYPKTWMNVFWPKYWLRPLTRRMRRERLFRLVERMVPPLMPLSRLLGRVPRLGRRLRWLVPVANYEGIHPLNEKQLYEWAVLDTFDMLSPAHDHPQTAATLREWMESAAVRDVEVLRAGHLVGRGTK
ncbi:MAG TPA: methyltransferase domain-containing protein [Thermoanaerobaculia bacterium]|nr:methyltransferase domain-containing protein [Thermoanaerobaculia bacterium]